jgi:hypothetical protein
MEPIVKLLGKQCQLIAASGAHSVLEGYRAYSLKVRTDNTQITSVTKIEGDTGVEEVVSSYSWQNVNLLAGIDYVPFEDPITAITLGSGTPSVMLFLERNSE